LALIHPPLVVFSSPSALQIPRLGQHQLDMPFPEDEIKWVVDELPLEKAPGPDGFTWTFYKACWGIIRLDIMAAFHCVYNQTVGPLHKLNGALLTLVPKTVAAEVPSDFRPISLIHFFAKLVAKVLALRLSPHINSLVSNSQNAFIKKRCIQDNFMYVRNLVRAYHRKKIPALLPSIHFPKGYHGRAAVTAKGANSKA
jgi:hypothetical protein